MPEWNKLPKEMQEMVVKRATKNTRNALRSCSMSSKILVEETRLEKRRSLHFLRISEKERKWKIEMTPDKNQKIVEFHLSSFEELQEKLIEVIQSIESIKNFTVCMMKKNSLIRDVKLMSVDDVDQRRILVENANFFFHNWSQQEKMLSQIEPVYLRQLYLECESGTSSKIYDMQQVIFAEKLSIYRNCSIRENQLLKLKANEVNLGNVNCSVVEFIAKCAFEVETTLPNFYFSTFSLSNLGLLEARDECSINEILLPTLNPQLMLGIRFVEDTTCQNETFYVIGNVRCQSESCNSGFWRFGQFQLRVIAILRISFQIQIYPPSCCEIYVKRKKCAPNVYKFETIEEFHEKLDEIMDNLDFIKLFEINFKNSSEKVNWKPRKKQLMIDKLIVHGDSSVTSIENLLQQVDPNFLRQVAICNDGETSKNGFLYDLPQIQNATLVTIDNPFLQDHQLLKINSLYFEGGGCLYDKNVSFFSVDGIINKTVTAKGINQFIKKCVGRGKAKEINFNLGRVSVSNETEMFEGLDIVEVFEMEDIKRFVLNTVDSEYVMEIRIGVQKHLSGYLIPRSEIKPGELYHSGHCHTYFLNLPLNRNCRCWNRV